MNFSFPDISVAGLSDTASITQLLNSAYRGDSSRKGWTTEAHLIAGDVRTTEAEVAALIASAGTVFLVYHNSEKICGCVNLKETAIGLYLGMFSVDPELQGAGTGRKLLAAAEAYARFRNTDRIYMTVISVRTELIAWYERNGYADTGKRIPFEEDGVSGKHLQPLAFMEMEKIISNE